MNLHSGAAIALGMVWILWLLPSRRYARGSTALPAMNWMLLVAGTLVAVEILGAVRGTDSAGMPALRHLAAVATFCPLMSLLGAKRPQDKPWQLIVLSLWVVLALPALETLIFRPAMQPDLHLSRRLFLAVLLLISLFNGLFTRHAWGALLATFGQVLLLGDLLPGISELVAEIPPGWRVAAALGCFLVSTALWTFKQRTPQRPLPLDQLWLDFRDLYGTIWGLRIADRINAAAQMYDWNVVLRWHGVCNLQGLSAAPDDETEVALRKMFRTLLRRFVSTAWIDARLGEASESLSIDEPGE